MPLAHRPVYRHQDLARLFNPQSIAIYGVSPNAASFGAKTRANLAGYQGKLYLINPKYDKIGDEPCYASIAALPEKPDCVAIALPAEAVEPAVLECAKGGAGGVLVFASGYAEMSQPERIARQQRLAAIARETGVKIVGPNCMGFMNFARLTLATFGVSDMKLAVPPRPGIGVASQSGALGYGLAQGVQRGLVVSHVITSGNSCDVNVADQIAYLAEEPSCSVIACIFEGLADPQQLIEAGEIAWKADKPVIACKFGAGEQGAIAAIAHTGSVVGYNAAYRAACERAGIIMLDDFEGLMEMASFFAKAPRRPAAHGVAVLSPSGGLSIYAADRAEKCGVPLPQPPDTVRAVLETLIPEFGSRRNPADVTAAVAGNLKVLTQCFDALAADPSYGALVFPQVLYSERTTERPPVFGELAARHQKPICMPLLGGWVGGPGYREAEMNAHTIPFITMESCFASLAEWHKRDRRHRDIEENGPRRRIRLSPASAAAAAGKLLSSAGNRLEDSAAKEVLTTYGLTTTASKPAGSLELSVAIQIDAQFGPLISATLHGDTAVELAPLTPAEALAMLRRLRSITALTAPAEGAPADLTAIAEAIVRIGEFGADQRELISGASIGRILCAGRNVMVLEAMVTRS